MKKIILLILLFISGLFSFSSTFAVSTDVEGVLDKVADNRGGEISVSTKGGMGIKDLMLNIGKKIILPIVIVIGLLIAFIGFYKLVFTDKEDERKKGLNFFIWGTIGVILMVSAWYITNSLVGNSGNVGIIGSSVDFKSSASSIASQFYDKVLHKFFVLAMYAVLFILFIVLLINVIKMLSSPDKEDIKKNTKTIIVWNIIGIIIIIFSKNIIEMFYKKVSNDAQSLGQQAPILESKNIGWLYTVLNYFLGFIAFAITIFIIYQAYLLLTKPDDEQTYKSLKKYFVYAIIGVLLIGGVYIIANFLIVKG